jgi:hypothetical protein
MSAPTDLAAHWAFWGWLVLISIVDFVVLREYYFNYPQWAKKHSVP